MRSLLAAGAAMAACLALAAVQAVAQEAEPSATPGAVGPDLAGATFRVTLLRVAGLDGLTLVGQMRSRGGVDRGDLFREAVEAPACVPPSCPGRAVFSITREVRLPQGVHYLQLIADESPCPPLSGAPCGARRLPERMCAMEFNLRRGDDVTVAISGVPETEEVPHRRLPGGGPCAEPPVRAAGWL
jgi:hypothetical protein